MGEPGGVRAQLLVLFLVVGAGTYLMRAVPLLVALGHLRRGSEPSGRDAGKARGEGRLGRALRLVAPSIIAGLLATSVLPPAPAQGFWEQVAPGVLALLPTLLVAARWRNLGLTVLVGVAAYWLLTLSF